MNRREVMQHAATATVLSFAGATQALGASCSELTVLIDAHRDALDAFHAAIDHQNELEDAFKAQQTDKEPIVRFLLGGGMSMYMGIGEIKKHAAAAYENQRKNLTQLARLDADLADQARRLFDVKEAENMELIDRVFADEEAHKNAFGLGEADQRWERTNEAERAAALAICSYRCRSEAELRMKADYLLKGPRLRDGLEEEEIEAMLVSMGA